MRRYFMKMQTIYFRFSHSITYSGHLRELLSKRYCHALNQNNCCWTWNSIKHWFLSRPTTDSLAMVITFATLPHPCTKYVYFTDAFCRSQRTRWRPRQRKRQGRRVWRLRQLNAVQSRAPRRSSARLQWRRQTEATVNRRTWMVGNAESRLYSRRR